MQVGKKRSSRIFCDDKKGLSAVVTTLIIILLAIVSISMVWVVVRNVISSGAEEINLEQFTLDIAIKTAYVSGNDLKVGIRRSAGGGEVTGLNFVFFNGTDSVIVKKNITLKELEERTFTFTSLEVPGMGGGDSVSVAPIFKSSGTEKTGDVTDTETISAVPPSGSSGGSESGGETGDPGTGVCGDSIIQNPNSNNVTELCDGSNLNGQSCIDLGFDGGSLFCGGGCQFDTSSCTTDAPSSCDGTWDAQDVTDGNECDAGFKCAVDCTCPAGFTGDSLGGCDLDDSINNGTINSVWNKVYIDSQDLPKSPATMIGYISYYVNFSNSPEIACFRIDFADYVSETDISYLRLDDALGFPNVAAGENYFIWEAEFCGA